MPSILADIQARLQPLTQNIRRCWTALHAEQRSPTTPQALDIEPSSLTLLTLGGHHDAPQVMTASMTALSPQTLTGDEVTSPEQLTECIQTLYQQAYNPYPTLAIAAPGTLVYTKDVPLPAGLPTVLWDAHAESEAQKAFPGMQDNIYFDYTVDMQAQEDAPSHLLLLATRRQDLQPRLNAIQAAGLNTLVIDVDFYALARAYSLLTHQVDSSGPRKAIGLLNIETTSLLLAVMYQDQMVYCHRQEFKGQALQHHLSLLPTSTHINPVSTSETTSTPNITPPSAETISNLCRMIVMFLQFYQPSDRNQRLGQLLLCGRGALQPELVDALSERMPLPITIADPFANMTLSPHASASLDLTILSPAFTLACGLAIRGLST